MLSRQEQSRCQTSDRERTEEEGIDREVWVDTDSLVSVMIVAMNNVTVLHHGNQW